MIIKSFPSGPFVTNVYVVVCEDTLHAAIIDPAPESAFFLEDFIEKRKLHVKKILLTHSHWDHTADLSIVKEKYSAPIYIHPADAPNLETPGLDGIPLLIAITPMKADIFLNDGDDIAVGNLKLQVIHTPGHTPGGVCFYIEKEAVLFSGDTLFRGSIGNLSFPTAEPERMWESLKRLEELPPETRIYSGHGEKTTIGTENWLPQAKEIFGS